MVDSMLKHLYPAAVDMEIESEWDERIKKLFTQEEKSAER